MSQISGLTQICNRLTIQNASLMQKYEQSMSQISQLRQQIMGLTYQNAPSFPPILQKPAIILMSQGESLLQEQNQHLKEELAKTQTDLNQKETMLGFLLNANKELTERVSRDQDLKEELAKAQTDLNQKEAMLGFLLKTNKELSERISKDQTVIPRKRDWVTAGNDHNTDDLYPIKKKQRTDIIDLDGDE